MIIEISDNREQWLIGLGRKYAAAVARENDARAAYDMAVKERIRLGEEIARIGGFINEAAAKREDGRVTTDQKIDRLCKRFPCLKDGAKAKGAKKKTEDASSEPIRRRDCQNWSGDHCAKTKGIDCRRDCVEYRRY